MNIARLLALPCAAWIACSVATAAPSTDRTGLLTDDRGMTLYVYQRDAPGVSRCNDRCGPWLPYVASASARPSGDFGIVRREDGSAQWAHRGRPLYRYLGDAAPGRADGDHAGTAWSTARTKALESRAMGSASDYAF